MDDVVVARRAFTNVVVLQGTVAEPDAVSIDLPAGAVVAASVPGEVTAGEIIATAPPVSPIGLRRAVEDAATAMDTARRQDDAAATPETHAARQAADLALKRAREDLLLGSTPGRTVEAPVSGTAAIVDGRVEVRPGGRLFTADAEPTKAFRLGSHPPDGIVTVALPSGRFVAACAGVATGSINTSAPSAAPATRSDEGPGRTAVRCTIDGGNDLVAGLAARLSVASATMPDAFVVPATAVVLDRGSTSTGTVVREGRRVAVTIRGVDGLSVAVDGDLAPGDRLQRYPDGVDGNVDSPAPSGG